MLAQKQYKAIDVLKLTFKIAPKSTFSYIIITLLNAILSTTIMAIALATFIDSSIDIFNNDKNISSIYMPFVFLITTVALSIILNSLPHLIESKIKYMIERELAPELIKLQANVSYQYIEDAESWEIMTILTDEMTETFLDGINAYMAILRSLVALISTMGLIFTQSSWYIGGIMMLCTLPLFKISLWAGEKNYKAKIDSLKYERRYSYYSDDVLTNRESVAERTLFGYVEHINKKYYKQFEKARDTQLAVLFKTKLSMRLIGISLILITFVMMLPFIPLVINNTMSAGAFIGIISALFAMVDTLGLDLQNAAKNIAEAKEYMHILTKLVHMKIDVGATNLPARDVIEFKSLEFKNVSFRYPNSNQLVLNNVSFKLDVGGHYAFVGENGSGKSTIIKLLTRLYDNYDGEILINDKELRTYKLEKLKSLYSVIYQDFAKYQISLKENLRLGNRALNSDKKMLDVAKKILSDKIVANGLDINLGKLNSNGQDLSGGQWQKIAIARSLLSLAPIKILDEPTASLDPISESELYAQFDSIMEGKTTIFISHRLGSPKLAHKIFVIHNGKIIESGSHKQLLEYSGKYAEMFNQQKRWYI